MTKSTHQHNSAQCKESLDKPPKDLARQGGLFSVIISEVMDSPFLPPGAKLLYTKISGLCNREGYCWATNKFLSEELFKSPCTIKRWLRILQDQGLILVHLDLCDKGVARKIFLQIGIKEKFKSDQKCTHLNPSREKPPQHIVRSDHFCTEGRVKNDPCINIILEEEEEEERPIGFGFRSSRKEAPEITEPQAQEAFEILTEYPEVSDAEANELVAKYTLEEIETQLKKIKLWAKTHGPIFQWVPTLRKFLLKAYGARNRCSALRQ